MAQRMPLAREAVTVAEELGDVWAEVVADGVVEIHEVRRIAPLIVDIQQITLLVDSAQTHAVASMRRGSTSKHARDSRVALVEAEQIITRRGAELSRTIQTIKEDEDARSAVEADAAAFGVTVDQYLNTITDVICDQLRQKREEGRQLLAARAESPSPEAA